ncbi:MAG: hypothetical protein ACI4I6_05905 [Hominimerdicola sp.]
MRKFEKRIILIFELILSILVVVSLNDRKAELVPKATPILCILMIAGAVVLW